MPGSVIVGGQTRTLKKLSCKVNNQWHEIKNGWAKDGGAWKKIYSSAIPITATYSGVADIVIKSPTSGYALLMTPGTFRFGEVKPPSIDAYLVGPGYYKFDKGPGVTYTWGGMINACYNIPYGTLSTSGIIADSFEANSDDLPINLKLNPSLTINSKDKNAYSKTTPVRAKSYSEYNPITDFWGRSWGQCGNEEYGGSSPIGQGGTKGLAQDGTGGKVPLGNGGRGGTSRGANGSDAKDATSGGGGAAWWDKNVDKENHGGKAERGGYGDSGVYGAEGCGGGAQGGCSSSRGETRPFCQGDGVIIIRWGNAEL